MHNSCFFVFLMANVIFHVAVVFKVWLLSCCLWFVTVRTDLKTSSLSVALLLHKGLSALVACYYSGPYESNTRPHTYFVCVCNTEREQMYHVKKYKRQGVKEVGFIFKSP